MTQGYDHVTITGHIPPQYFFSYVLLKKNERIVKLQLQLEPVKSSTSFSFDFLLSVFTLLSKFPPPPFHSL